MNAPTAAEWAANLHGLRAEVTAALDAWAAHARIAKSSGFGGPHAASEAALRRMAASIDRIGAQPIDVPATTLYVISKAADDTIAAQLAERERRINPAPPDQVLSAAWDALRNGRLQ